MSMKKGKLVLPALLVTLTLLAFAPPAAAIKSCAECTIYDPCNLICYINDDGRTVYMVCDEFACSGEMMSSRTSPEIGCSGLVEDGDERLRDLTLTD